MTRISLRHIIASLLIASAGAAAPAAVPAGPVAKIAVDHTGIYRITAAELASMGLGDASGVAVYGAGGVENAVTEDGPVLPEVASMVTPRGDLIFYGEGPERYGLMSTSTGFVYGMVECNPSTRCGYYYLAASGSPRRVATVSAEAGGAILSSHISMGVYHPQLTNPARAGSTFLGEDFSRNEELAAEIPFDTPDAVPNARVGLRLRGAVKATNPKLVYRLDSISTAESSIYSLSSSWSNYDDPNVFFGATGYAASTYTMPEASTDRVTLRVSAAKSGDVAYAAVESATLVYHRNNVMPADGTPLEMHFYGIAGGSTLSVAGGDEDICIWDVTDPVSPVAMNVTATAGGTEATVPWARDGAARIMAFDPAGNLGRVESAGSVTLTDFASMPVPGMVIVTAPALRQEAERIASMHRAHSGMAVAVAEQQEVFDVYGSGSASPRALRRFIRTLYDRDSATLRHLLLVGAATFDPAGHTGTNPDDPTRVIAYETEDLMLQGDDGHCFCADAFFGMLGDDDPGSCLTGGMMSINVGRIPATSAAQVRAYADKAERYLTSPQGADASTRALVIGDYGDRNGHALQALALADSIENRWGRPCATVTRAITALFEPDTRSHRPLLDKVTGTLHEGVGYMSYSGHGNPLALGSGSFLSRTAINAFSNRTLPVVMLATCYALGFDRDDSSVGESFLFNADGGAIGLVASGRSVQMTYNQTLNLAMGRAYYTAGDGATLGDVFRTARNSILGRKASAGLIINTSCYNFVGDPALPLRRPAVRADIDNSGSMEIVPLARNSISGTVVQPDGSTATAFDGRVMLSLYAPARTDNTMHDPEGCAPIPVQRRETVVAAGVDTVRAGRFSTCMQCPVQVSSGDGYKLVVHAVDRAGELIAVTAVDNVRVGNAGDRESLDDGVPPAITELWIDSPGFTDGDVVGPSVALHAVITPSSTGIDCGNVPERRMYVSVDGTRYNDIANNLTFASDGTATLSYRLENLADGNHTLTLSVADNAGNRARRQVNFCVISTLGGATLAVEETTATGSVTFTLGHAFTAEPECRLIVDDAAGDTVFSSSDVSFPFTWNLRDIGGNSVPDGCYTARVMLRINRQYGATKPVKFVIVKE